MPAINQTQLTNSIKRKQAGQVLDEAIHIAHFLQSGSLLINNKGKLSLGDREKLGFYSALKIVIDKMELTMNLVEGDGISSIEPDVCNTLCPAVDLLHFISAYPWSDVFGELSGSQLVGLGGLINEVINLMNGAAALLKQR